MEEAGWVARTCYPSGDVWYILPADEQAIERWRVRAGLDEATA
jgi:hypothetical protein